MLLQSSHQGIEGNAAGGTVTQILVHRNPGIQLQRELLAEYAHEAIALGDGHLAKAYARSGPDECQLRQIAIRSHGERFALQGRKRLANGTNEGGRLIESDERMVL